MEGTSSAADRAVAHVLRIQAIGLRSQASLLETQAASLDEMADRALQGNSVEKPDGTLDDQDFAILKAMVKRANTGQVSDTDGIAADVSDTAERTVKRLQRLVDLQFAMRASDGEEWYPTGISRQALAAHAEEEGHRG